MPTTAELIDLAVRCHRSGNLRDAEALYRQVLQAEPAHAAAHHLLGLVAQQTGRHQTALALVRQAIALEPAVSVFHFNLGVILKHQGQQPEAIASFRRAVALDPANVDALCNLGVALRDQGQGAQAVACYRQALRVNPGHAKTHNNLGNALKDLGEFTEAAQCFAQALRINPDYANAHYNLGVLLKDKGELAEAVASFRQALRCNRRHADAHNNLGVSLMHMGHYADALAHYEEALGAEPGNATALWNRSLLRLLEGDFERGWPDYEYRWTQPGFVRRHEDRPHWDGSSLQGKTILLHAEQGLGDTIHFVRYAPLVKERGGTVLLECPPRLAPLLSGIAGVDRLIDAAEPRPPFDVQAPLLSLPGIFGTNLATIPAAIPYLKADAALVEYWQRELAPLGGFKVGIAWQGSLVHQGDRYRSVALVHFESLARVPGVTLVSLQKGPGSEQVRECAGRFPILDLGERLDRAGAFLDTAAVLKNLDLVITVDTAVAHLAGALGVPVWVVLTLTPDWRWLRGRADSPWYPTMRLFRQCRFGDWGEVFERVAAALSEKCGERRGVSPPS